MSLLLNPVPNGGRSSRQRARAANDATPLPALEQSIAHELNQPLAAIALHAAAAGKWLRRAEPDVARALASLALIGAAAVQAGDIVRGLHGLAAGRRHASARVDIDGAVRDTLPLLQPRLHGIGIELALGLDGATIDANRAQLQQVITNLVLNATEAHAGSGLSRPHRIRITTRRYNDHEIELAVSDNGPGVKSADQVRLFADMFSTKSDASGAARGIGLPICQSIVRAHGGSILFEPGQPHGACFRVRLPAHQ